MGAFQKIIVFTCAALLALIVYYAIKIWFMPEPQKGTGCKNKGEQWSDDCTTLQEITPDSSLTSPKGKSLFLLSFVNDSGLGSPFTSPVWYRFRYVNSSTGGYSEFSDWTPYPVQSGACCLPCQTGGLGCGKRSCDSNKPTLAILQSQLDYTIDSPLPGGVIVYVSLHSYVGGSTPPSSTVTSTPIGNMYPQGNTYYTAVDFSNPCGGGKCSGKCTSTGACPPGCVPAT